MPVISGLSGAKLYQKSSKALELPMFELYAFILTAAAGLATSHAAPAANFERLIHLTGERVGQVQARRAFQQGKIRSLGDIMATVRPEFGGEVIEVELETEHGGYFYIFKVVRPKGRIVEISVDAATGKVVEKEED
jgi:uncharacterized membrane protein YkoI